MSKLDNRIGGIIEVDWQNLTDLQPDNVKIHKNHENLKQSLLKHGFALPFFVWKNDNIIYCLDGHTRKQVLNELQSSGTKVPKKLKAVEIIANDRKEAIEILLEVFNQKHNPFSDELLVEWLEIEEIDKEEINLKSIPIEITSFDDFEGFGDSPNYSDKNQEIDIDSFDDEMTLKFKFTEETYNEVKSKLQEIDDHPETALLKILQIE